MTDTKETQLLLGKAENRKSAEEGEPPETCISCDPRSSVHRYIFLVFLCLIGVGT